jgi:hypothetical protein
MNQSYTKTNQCLLNATNTWFLFLLKIVLHKNDFLRIRFEDMNTEDADAGKHIPSTKDVAKTYR